MKKVLIYSLFLLQITVFGQTRDILLNSLEDSKYNTTVILKNNIINFENDRPVKLNDSTVVLNRNNNIYKSTNLGKSFKFILTVPKETSWYDFVNDSVVYVTTSLNKVLKTTDAGKTWVSAFENIYNTIFFSLQFADENNGIIYYSEFINGKMYKKMLYTLDGGKTWFVSEKHPDYLLRLYYKGKNPYIYTMMNEIYTSEDNGKTWKLIKKVDLGNIKLNSVGFRVFSNSVDAFPFVVYKINE